MQKCPNKCEETNLLNQNEERQNIPPTILFDSISHFQKHKIAWCQINSKNGRSRPPNEGDTLLDYICLVAGNMEVHTHNDV